MKMYSAGASQWKCILLVLANEKHHGNSRPFVVYSCISSGSLYFLLWVLYFVLIKSSISSHLHVLFLCFLTCPFHMKYGMRSLEAVIYLSTFLSILCKIIFPACMYHTCAVTKEARKRISVCQEMELETVVVVGINSWSSTSIQPLNHLSIISWRAYTCSMTDRGLEGPFSSTQLGRHRIVRNMFRTKLLL